MKKLFTLILFIAWAFNANGQIVRDSTYLADSAARAEIIRQVPICHGCLIGLEGTDALGNKDTLYFGADTTATVGIDNQFGEFDITGRPLKPMDMRFFQRPEVCLATLPIGDSVPFRSPTFLRYRESYELKRSIKTSFQGFNGRIVDTYTASANKFIFRVNTQNYPISFKLIQKTGSNQHRDLREVAIWSFRNCNYALPTKFLRQVNSTDTIKYPAQNDHYFIGGIIYIINSAKKKVKMKLGVFPIPATEKIQITGLRTATNISITTIAGKEIKNLILNPESTEVNIEGLEKGIYIIHCQSKDGVQALRIVKQ